MVRIVTDVNGRRHITSEPLLHSKTYSQEELDAAVAAERERCAVVGAAAADAGMDGAGVAAAIRGLLTPAKT